MEKNKIKICVTGAAGNIAYSLIPMIMSGQVFGPRTSISLTLLDLPQFEYALKGIVMELEDGAYPLLDKVEYGTDPVKLFEDCDLVIFLGGASRQPGQERRDLLSTNGSIFKEQGEALNKVAKSNCKCLVVANPCNTNCYILQQYCTKLPKQNFTSLSRLDHNRAVAQIATKLKQDPSKIKKVIVWGNHSVLQYPDLSYAEVEGKKVVDVLDNDNYIRKEFMKYVQQRGAEVLFQRKKSSVFSAAKAVVDHLIDWFFGSESGNWVSMGIISDGSYGIPEGLVFSCPVICRNSEYELVKDLTLSDFSKQQLKFAIAELVDEKEETLEELH
jgi:malate dehydrogenase